MSIALAGAALLVSLLLVALVWQRDRRRFLAGLRDKWGKPTSRASNSAGNAAACRSRLKALGKSAAIDERTWADLDLDAVCAAIDRTESTLGQQALHYRLHTSPGPAGLEPFEALVMRMTTDVRARERAQLALARLQDRRGYNVWRLAAPGAVVKHSWHAIFPLLTVLTVATAAAALLWPGHWLWLAGVVMIDVAARSAAVTQISDLRSTLRQIAPIVATGEDLAFLQGEQIAPIVGTIASDASRLRRLKTIARWLSGDPFMASFTSSGLITIATQLAGAVYEYLNLLLLLDANSVYFGTADLSAGLGSLLRLVAAIGDVDAALSVASFRQERNDWTRPHFSASGSAARFTDLRHPLVADAVPNSIGLEAGRGILITGSNMSGKSTFLRTVGANAIMAQSLNTCLATAYDAPLYVVQSCIGRQDDLVAGKSYYIVEVEQVLARVSASRSDAPHLFLFDELFRGTNAVERIAAAEATLRELLERHGGRRPHVVITATHDGELVELLSDSYLPYHFTDTIGPEGLVFDYRLAPGESTTRNAIALLELNGAPPSLVQRALSRAAILEHQRVKTT